VNWVVALKSLINEDVGFKFHDKMRRLHLFRNVALGRLMCKTVPSR